MISIGGNDVTPEEFVNAIRNGMNESSRFFKNGGCYELFILMRSFWKDAVAWYDPIVGHVYAKIGEHWYDIDGKHTVIPKCASVMCRREIKSAHRWSWGRRGPSRNITWGKLTFPPINLLNAPYVCFEGNKNVQQTINSCRD